MAFGPTILRAEVKAPGLPPLPDTPGEPDLLPGVDPLVETAGALPGLPMAKEEGTSRPAHPARDPVPEPEDAAGQGMSPGEAHDAPTARSAARRHGVHSLLNEGRGNQGVGIDKNKKAPPALGRPPVPGPRDLAMRLRDHPRPEGLRDYGSGIGRVVVHHDNLVASGRDRLPSLPERGQGGADSARLVAGRNHEGKLRQ